MTSSDAAVNNVVKTTNLIKMAPTNLLIILSDEHNPHVMGCAGHPEVHTPHLDALAASGTRFTNAVCASPICVPTRAALAVGRPIHEIGYWDNVDAFDGRIPTWHHLLRAAGHEVVSIGKLHFRGWEGDEYGFSETLLPMHIHGGRGELRMLLRDPPVSVGDGSSLLRSAQAGSSDYTRYDDKILEEALHWLADRAGSSQAAKPWVLMVSLVAPHFPLTAPPPFFARYQGQPLELPKNYRFGIHPDAHPYAREYAQVSGYNLHFKSDDDVRRALCGYYGLVSALDDKVGRLRAALQANGLLDHTRVMYLSDHGDNAGARGLWGKSTMYSESVGIPMILSGADIKQGHIEQAAVSHLDVFNTVLDTVGYPLSDSTASAQSCSLLRPLNPDRTVLSEYHTIGSRSALFMLQDKRTKYVHYCDYEPELFDLERDPQELINLAPLPAARERLEQWSARLRERLDPTEVDQRAKARQRALIEHFGGVDAILKGPGIGGYTPSPS